MDDDRIFDDDLVDLVEASGVIDKLSEPKRYLRDAENPVKFYYDREFIRRFRFSKDTVVNVIVPLLTGPNQNAHGLPVPPLIKVVSMPDMEILDIVARWPGSTYDARIFSNSRMKTRLWTRQGRGNLLGDNMVGCFATQRKHSPLKKTPESPEIVDTKFWLYTPSNITSPQLIQYGDRLYSLEKSDFQYDLPVKVLIHGFKGSGKDKGAIRGAHAFLDRENVNVIIVDWEMGAANSYPAAVANTELVGRQMSLLLFDMLTLGANPSKMHVIGFSLGAHIAGCAGHILQNRGVKLGRITGLDPASPIFKNHHLLDPYRKLDASDADFVDIIHTDGSPIWTDGFGLLRQSGHVDFFPNGGREQPSCNDGRGSVVVSHFDRTVDINVACSHVRAWKLFLESMTTPPGGCRFMAYPCQAGLPGFLQGSCFPAPNSCNISRGDPQQSCGFMGYDAQHSKGRGALYLVTRDTEPYCGEQLRATIYVSEKTQRTRGILNLHLRHGISSTNFQIKCEYMDIVQGGRTMWGLAAAEFGTIDPLLTPTIVATLSYQSLTFQTANEADTLLPSPQIYLNQVGVSDHKGNSWRHCGKETVLEDKNQSFIEQVTLTLTLNACS
uniref:Lipase domain-containing protein n=1 Tax=Timema douglasi TaxID=61478 RepID=A0A7R8V9W6_TIMDO|nr:unnamed protein product [Timema douglasi]